MSKHTPGPWTLLGSEIRSSDRGVALIKWEHARYGDPARGAVEAEDRANACLIAAAPELLEACKEALRQSCCDGDLCAYGWHDLARAAIQKAEGAE